MHESITNRQSKNLVILANGYNQRVDMLKSTELGAVATGMNIFKHSLDKVVAHNCPGIYSPLS
jgi:hypothetical protein